MTSSIVAGALALALVAGRGARPSRSSAAKVEAALPQIEAMAAKLVADGAVPGIAIVVVHADEVVYLGGFGLREVGKPETVDADTVFQLASMSKPISATVVAKLVSDGVVGWDSRIADLNPAFQLHDPFPTAEVTRHRPAQPPQRPARHQRRRPRGHRLRPRRRSPQRLRLVPPSSSFRAGYAYSNAGFTQGALAAAMADRAVLGEGRRGAALPAARHGRHQLAARRLRGAPQPRRRCTSPRRAAGPRSPRASPTRRRRPAASAPRCATSRSGCGSSSAPATGKARRSSTRTRSPRPTSRCSTAAPTRSAAPPPSTAAAGTRSSAATAGPGAMPAPSAPGRAPS